MNAGRTQTINTVGKTGHVARCMLHVERRRSVTCEQLLFPRPYRRPYPDPIPTLWERANKWGTHMFSAETPSCFDPRPRRKTLPSLYPASSPPPLLLLFPFVNRPQNKHCTHTKPTWEWLCDFVKLNTSRYPVYLTFKQCVSNVYALSYDSVDWKYFK